MTTPVDSTPMKTERNPMSFIGSAVIVTGTLMVAFFVFNGDFDHEERPSQARIDALADHLEVAPKMVNDARHHLSMRGPVQAQAPVCKPASSGEVAFGFSGEPTDGWSVSARTAKTTPAERWQAREIFERHLTMELSMAHPAPHLLFYGDGLFEAFRETCTGRPCAHSKVSGAKGLFQNRVVKRYGPSNVMAISGDGTADVLKRLEKGERPLRQPRAIVLHVGTNDLFTYHHVRNKVRLSGHVDAAPLLEEKFDVDTSEEKCIDGVYLGVKAIVKHLWRHCGRSVPILLTSILPRGEEWPGGEYHKLIPQVNYMLARLAQSTPNLRFVNCQSAFVLNTTDLAIDTTSLPDFLHPSLIGLERWIDCLTPVLDKMLGHKP